MNAIRLMLKGAAMGVAEVIPGVSGGTIAFITGIYEELINTIKSFDVDFIKLLSKGKLLDAWNHVNGGFLLKLISGMLAGVVFGVFVVTHLLETYPEYLWSFFFGLILASIYIIFSMMKAPKVLHLVFLIIGTAIAYGLVSLNPQAGSDQSLYLFVCGAIAISALILPGISGSFLLLILGAYTLVIPTAKNFLSSPEMDEFKIILIFGLGCVVGLVFFSRILSWTFNNYYDKTLAVLCGFMLGSLVKIWPWRNPVQIINKDTAQISDVDLQSFAQLDLDRIEIIKEVAVMPANYYQSTEVMIVCLVGLLGFSSVLLLHFLSKKN